MDDPFYAAIYTTLILLVPFAVFGLYGKWRQDKMDEAPEDDAA